MEFWVTFWKITLIAGIAIFAVVALWVSIFGFLDIRKLFKTLAREHEQEEQGEESN